MNQTIEENHHLAGKHTPTSVNSEDVENMAKLHSDCIMCQLRVKKIRRTTTKEKVV